MKYLRHCLSLVCFLLLSLQAALGAAPSTVAEAIQQIRSVDSHGKGHTQAVMASRFLATQDAGLLDDLLIAMDGANPLAANWLRASVETIASRSLKAGQPLPTASLGEFLLDVRHAPSARQLAFDLLSQSPSNAVQSLLPGMLHDPSMPLRRSAVQGVLEQAMQLQTNGQSGAATLLFQQGLNAARDPDQINLAASRLKDLGYKADLQKVFGWVRDWKIIGPFDNSQRAGFDQVFPPEKEINLSAEYDGKEGKVRWMDLSSKDEYGKVDANLPLGKLKEAMSYCYTELHSARPVSAEIRLGCKNAWKVWLNGKLLFGRDEYHRGAEIDQYRMPCELVAGKNTLLIKLGQNEQKERWTEEWEFQLRVTDALGTPISPLRVGVPQPTTASR